MSFETTSKPYGHNQTFDVSPPRIRRAKDKISLPEGRLEEKSETSSQYLPHENQPKAVASRKRPTTKLKLGSGGSENSRKGSWSAKRNEHKTFIQGVTTKTKPTQLPDNIQLLQGTIESQTESTDQYQRHGHVQRQKKVVIKNGLEGPKGIYVSN